MSGKTDVGADTTGPSRERADEDGTLRAVVTDALGDAEVESIVYRENTGTLDSPDDEWRRYDAVEDLPTGSVDGWDELYVYTATHVYRWVGVGYNRGPERLPRDPSSLPDA